MSLYIADWKNLPREDRGASVAIGAFDGVHLGHREVIAAARAAGEARSAKLGIVTFRPHPREFFNPKTEPFHLASPEQQAIAFHGLGVKKIYELPFDAEMAAMSPEAFARDVLAEGLGVVHVSAGFDITFGKARSGDAETLRQMGDRFGFGVTIVDRADDAAGDKLSSTAAREAVREGDMARAAAILGRPFAIVGQVRAGRGKGRELGFPTANIGLGDYVRPRFGVYAVRAGLEDGRRVPGCAYIGAGQAVEAVEPRLEAWLFDFDEDLYGQVIEVELIAFIRPDADFENVEALQAQAAMDAAEARLVLGV